MVHPEVGEDREVGKNNTNEGAGAGAENEGTV
jgi:hypothetical protein